MKVVWLTLTERLDKICLGPDRDNIKHIEVTRAELEEIKRQAFVPESVKDMEKMSTGTLNGITFECGGKATDVNLIKTFYQGIELKIVN